MFAAAEHLELDITGMTCAACAARIEKKLNRLDGVNASVNYALERASVDVTEASAESVDVIGAVEALGYGASLRTEATSGAAEEDDELTPAERAAEARLADLRQRLIVSAALALPVVLLSMIPALQFRNWQWLAFALTAPVAVWGAWPFHRAAWKNLLQRTATMDTLVSLGIIAAFGWSVWALFFGNAGVPGMKMTVDLFAERGGHGHGVEHDEIYLEVASAVVVFMLAGRYFEARAKRRSSKALRALLALGAKEASVLREGREVVTPIAAVRVGDLIVVRPGEKVATDGVVVEGVSAIDNSILTGESIPTEVGVDEAVTGGSINVGGRIVVRATWVGADTALAQMARLVEQAQSGKAPVQRLADRVSAVFVPIVVLLSMLTLGAWLAVTGDVDQAFTAAVAVLIIACPCALGLATPTALLVGTTRGAQLGLIIKGPEVLEGTRDIDTIALDKTGTVTTGRMEVVAVENAPGVDRDQALWLTASLESASEHPVARAIVRAAVGLKGERLASPSGFASMAGRGVTGMVDGRMIVAGRPDFIVSQLGALPDELADAVELHECAGRTVIVAGWNGAPAVAIAVADAVKPSSAQAIGRLRSLGLRPVLLTGDNRATALAVAADVGIAADDVIAGVLPEGKVAAVQELQRSGATVAMVGDGVNDGAALAQADLGIALGTGADVAIEASDLTIVSGDLNGAVDAIRLSRRTLGTIKVNLFWAFAYNVAALPLAAFGVLTPVIAGLAMAMSSVFVVSNSLRLRSFR